MALLGTGPGVEYRLDSDTYIDVALSPADASVTIAINSNGTVVVTSATSGTLANYNWLTPTTGSTTYYVRADEQSGSFSTGVVSTWLALTSNRVWSVDYPFNTPGGNTVAATFDIATDSAGTNIVVSAAIGLEAYVDI